MKIPALVLAAAAGYLLGTRSGRARLAGLAGRVSEVAADPATQQRARVVVQKVEANAHLAPFPFSAMLGFAAKLAGGRLSR